MALSHTLPCLPVFSDLLKTTKKALKNLISIIMVAFFFSWFIYG